MAVKKPAKAPVSKPSKSPVSKSKSNVTPTSKLALKNVTKPVKSESSYVSSGWLQDATLEIPVSPAGSYAPGERELEFSVGMRQQEDEGIMRSELRGRALVHASGQVLALAEASYVIMTPLTNIPADLPQQLYGHLRTHLEGLLALGGHTPPLPASLEKVA